MAKTPYTSDATSRETGTDEVVGKARLDTRKTNEAAAPDIGLSDAQGLPITDASKRPDDAAYGSRLKALFAVAHQYGEYSFDNYARIRSLAETLRDEFCAWLSEGTRCVFLVPPEGRFSAKDYQSAAFSVAGKGYLPLKPISFGLAVRVSEDKDFMRLKLTCRKEGDVMFVRLERGSEIRVPQPVTDESLLPLFEAIYAHLIEFFQQRIDDYDHGRYGTQDIGFDIQRMTG